MSAVLRGLGVPALAAALLIATLAAGAGAATTITYGLVSYNPFHWVVIAGVAKGDFERHGVKLDIPIAS